MGQQSLSGTDISALREEYLQKVTEELPARAQTTDSWPITDDHCFARVVLDTLFEDEWSNHISRSPAYKQLSENQLRAAITIADRMLTEGQPAVEELNQQSLRWRQAD
jgi:hypothetical protein